jgi:hypothetical protein
MTSATGPGPASADELAELFRTRTTPGPGGLYESYFLKAADPAGDRALWIRWTTHRAPGADAEGTLWLSWFDRGRVRQAQRPGLPIEGVAGGGLALGTDARIDPATATGALGAEDAIDDADRAPSRWSLATSPRDRPLRHLRPERLYRLPIPRTKLTSPYPDATVDGRATLFGEEVEVDHWRGMVGHNWGSEHAERWIWLHGSGFDGDPDAWVDVALARVRIGPLLTPWTAVGAISVAGSRRSIRGVVPDPLAAAGAGAEGDAPAVVVATRRGGVRIEARARPDAVAAWTYHDPAGGTRSVRNCSLATVSVAIDGGRRLTTSSGVVEVGRS